MKNSNQKKCSRKKILHLTIQENGHERFITKGGTFESTIIDAMGRYADQETAKLKEGNAIILKGVANGTKMYEDLQQIEISALKRELEEAKKLLKEANERLCFDRKERIGVLTKVLVNRINNFLNKNT